MMPQPALKTLAIVGNGLEAWTTALFLKRKLGPVCPVISVVETDPGEGAPALSTLPWAVEWLADLGFDPIRLTVQTGGTMKLGDSFAGTGAGESAGFLPYGQVGAPIGPVQFHQQLARLGLLTETRSFADYSLAALAARAGRFAPPASDPRSMLAGLEFGLHLDAHSVCDAMRTTASALGVRALTAAFVDFRRNTTGHVTAVMLGDGQTLDTQFVIDTRRPADSGADWKSFDFGPFDRIAISDAEHDPEQRPLTGNELASASWSQYVPLQDRMAVQTVIASAFAAGTPLADRSRPLRCGRTQALWQHNQLHIGPAGWQLPPFATADLSILAKACDRLLATFPTTETCHVENREYNRLIAQEIDTAADFAQLLMRIQSRPEPAWQAARDLAASSNVDDAIALFRSRGRLMLDEFCHHGEAHWIRAMLAMGVRPDRHDPQADALDGQTLRERTTRIRGLVHQALADMPAHARVLDRFRSQGAP